jgi:2-polyprenyl-3-methyl-5-hydroxy-6-metoxy-1,4-benzoquinol methylase
MGKLADTGERMVPEYHSGSMIYAEHMARYSATKQFVKGKTILDIACGTGYGSFLMADAAKKIFAVDIDQRTIDYAKKNFFSKNIEYSVGSATEIPMPDNMAEVVVSFETIEHINDYKKFLSEVKRVLKPGGLLVISTPNDAEFSEENHFHLHEFVLDELTILLKENFKNVDIYYQADWLTTTLLSKDELRDPAIKISVVNNLDPKKPEQSVYFYALCSDSKLPSRPEAIVTLGEHWSARDLQKLSHDHEKKVHKLKEKVNYLENAYKDLVAIKDDLEAKLNSRGLKR